MDSLPSVNSSYFWMALLYLTVMAAALSLTAGAMLAWRRRPIKKDELQRYKLHERLAQMSVAAQPEPKKLV